MQHLDSKSCRRSPSFLSIALCTTIALFSSISLADEGNANDWHRALVKVESDRLLTAKTGVIVKVDRKNALILTVWEYRGEQVANPQHEEFTVTVKMPDGSDHELKGKVADYVGFSPLFMEQGRTGYLAVIKATHDGLKLESVDLTNAAPDKDSPALAAMADWDDDNDAPHLQKVTISNNLNPATCNPLRGKITGSDWSQQEFLTVHDPNGTLVGIASSGGFAGAGFGGGMGGGGFGGGTGGGFFSVQDPEAAPAGAPIPPLTFVAVVDYASQLRDLGVPVSEELLKQQATRRRIYNDRFGRPVSSQNIQVTWSDDHKELHGFSNARGEWAKLRIEERDSIIPIVGTNVAAVSLNGSIAAYSGEKGVWDIVKLRPGSQALPSVDNNVVTVQDGKNYYTFAASSGVWTSPTDPDYQKIEIHVPFEGDEGRLYSRMRETNNRANAQTHGGGLQISGIKHHVDAAVEILQSLQRSEQPNHILSDLIAKEAELNVSLGSRHPKVVTLRRQIAALRESQPALSGARTEGVISATSSDAASIELAKQLRDKKNHDSASVEKLRQLVTQSFEERLNQQQELATKLERKFEEIRKAIESRQSNRDRIIERRVEELLDPTIDWSKLEPKQDTGSSGVPVADVPVDLSGVVMLEFTASHCKPCQQMIPVMQRMKSDGFPIQTIDVTAQLELSRRYNVDRIPTLIVMVEGKEVERLVGIQSDAKLRRIMNDAIGKLEETALSRAKQAIESVGRTTKGSLDPTTVDKRVAIRFTLPRDVPLMHDHRRIDSLSLVPSDGTVEIGASGTATQLAELYRQILNELDDDDEVAASFAVPKEKLKPVEGEGIHAAVTGFGYRGTKAELAFFDEFLNWVAPRLNDSTTTPDDFANKSLEIQRRQGRLPGIGMPVTGTPVGLPGPPHIPLGGAGVFVQSYSASDHEAEKTAGAAAELIKAAGAARKTADTIRHEQKHLNTYLNLIRQVPDLETTGKQEIEASVRGSVKKIRGAQQEFRRQMTKWRDLWKTHASRFQDEQAARDLFEITTLELANKEERNRTFKGVYSADEILRAKSERIAAEIELLQTERKAKDMQAVREKVAELNPAEFDTKPLMVDSEIAASRTLMAASFDASKRASEQQIELRIPRKEFRTEGGSLRVSFDDIDLLKVLNMDAVSRNAVDHFPDWLNNLDGQRIRIRGFMLPGFKATGIKRFALARDNEICSFAREAKVYEVLQVSLAANEATDYIDGKPFDVEGIFKIDTNTDDDELVQLYRLENAKIIR